MKSSFSDITIDLISGSQTIAFGFPLNYGNFASMSPNVRVTESLPGNTL